MNFKLTFWKTIVSFVVAFLISFYGSFIVFCIGDCLPLITILGETYGFNDIHRWVIFIGVFLFLALLVYLIWSFIQKKK